MRSRRESLHRRPAMRPIPRITVTTSAGTPPRAAVSRWMRAHSASEYTLFRSIPVSPGRSHSPPREHRARDEFPVNARRVETAPRGVAFEAPDESLCDVSLTEEAEALRDVLTAVDQHISSADNVALAPRPRMLRRHPLRLPAGAPHHERAVADHLRHDAIEASERLRRASPGDVLEIELRAQLREPLQKVLPIRSTKDLRREEIPPFDHRADRRVESATGFDAHRPRACRIIDRAEGEVEVSARRNEARTAPRTLIGKLRQRSWRGIRRQLDPSLHAHGNRHDERSFVRDIEGHQGRSREHALTVAHRQHVTFIDERRVTRSVVTDDLDDADAERAPLREQVIGEAHASVTTRATTPIGCSLPADLDPHGPPRGEPRHDARQRPRSAKAHALTDDNGASIVGVSPVTPRAHSVGLSTRRHRSYGRLAHPDPPRAMGVTDDLTASRHHVTVEVHDVAREGAPLDAIVERRAQHIRIERLRQRLADVVTAVEGGHRPRAERRAEFLEERVDLAEAPSLSEFTRARRHREEKALMRVESLARRVKHRTLDDLARALRDEPYHRAHSTMHLRSTSAARPGHHVEHAAVARFEGCSHDLFGQR